MRSHRVRLLVLLALLGSLPLLAQPVEPGASSEWAVQRVFLTPERLTAELAKSPGVTWKQLPRNEFESKLRQAENLAAQGKVSPRVLGAHFIAMVRDEDLIGLARWDIQNPEGPGVLPLHGVGGAFNLALRGAPREGDREILLAEVDSRGPSLLLESPGLHTVELPWSSRLERTADGLTMELRGPPSPVGLLELYLPADWGITGPAEVLLTGPLPLPAAEDRGGLDIPQDHARWRVFGLGRTALRLNLHPSGDTSPPLALVQRWLARHRLAPDGIETTLETALDLLPRDGKEVTFEWDPALRPHAVEVSPVGPDSQVPELADWVLNPAGDGKTSLLTIRLRRAVPEVAIVIRALAPLTGKPGPRGAREWTAPVIRVVRGVPRSEILQLHFHRDLRIDSWETGDYQPTASDTPGEVDVGPTYSRLTLVGGGLRPNHLNTPRQPSVNFHSAGVDFRARAVTWWRVHPTRSVLQSAVSIEVQQGRLFELPVLLPPGWEVEQVDMEPANPGLRWRPRRERGRTQVQIEFPSPLTPTSPTLDSEVGPLRSQARVNLRLRTSQGAIPLGKKISFPEIQVVGARFREGALGIHHEGHLLQGQAVSPLIPGIGDEEGPWGREVPEFYYAYRQQALAGSLTVQLRSPQLSGQIHTAVNLTSEESTLETGFRLTVEAGAPGSIDLLVPRDSTPDWEWQAASGNLQVRRVDRLPGPDVGAVLSGVLGPSPLGVVPSLVLPMPACYRVTLSRPLRPRETVELLARTRLRPINGRLNIPVPMLSTPEGVEGEVDVHLTGTELAQVEMEGLRELTVSSRSQGRGSWRGYQSTGGPVRLSLQIREPSLERLAEAHARLTAWPTGKGVCVHYQLKVGNWTKPTLPVHLPPGSELLAARVDGRAISPQTQTDQVVSLPVPVRAGAQETWVHFELLYDYPQVPGSLWQALQADAPTMPLEVTTLRRVWRLPTQTVPLLPWQALRVPGPADGIDPPPVRIHPGDLFRLIPWPRRWLEWLDPPPVKTVPLGLTLVLVASRPGQEVSLREMLELMAQGAVREQGQIIVDTGAWSESRLQLTDRVRLATNPADAESVWTSLGLSLIPVSDGWLLTTQGQVGYWYQGRQPLPEPVVQAVEEAGRDGFDRSGRFRVLENWLPLALRGEAGGDEAGRETLLPGDLELPGWSAWEILQESPTELMVARREMVATGGIILALLGGLLWLAARAGARWRRILGLILWIALSGLALIWLPTPLQPLAWYPLVLGGLFVLLAYLRRLRKATGLGSNSTITSASVSLSAGVLLLLVCLALPSRAFQEEQQASPSPTTVFVVGKPEDDPDRQIVWIPNTLLERLRKAGNPKTGWPQEGVVLTGVRCTGKPVDGVGQFTAQFDLYSFSEEPTTYQVPLEEVVLQKPAWLDDAVIKPVALPRPQRGYLIRLSGKGRHRLELSFRVPIQSTAAGEDSLQFTLPRSLNSRLRVDFPGTDVVGQVHARLGAGLSRFEGNQTILEADLGRMPGAVQIRWTTSTAPRQSVPVRYLEAYLWELRQDESLLTGVLRYSIEKGNLRELVLDIPERLVVRGVTATRPGGGEARLQGFRIVEHPGREASRRQELIVRFQAPTSGELLLRLDMIPRGPLPETAELTLPSPRGEQTGGFLAYRVVGLEARPLSLLRLTGIQRERFAPFWPAATRPQSATLAFAATFTRPGGADPEVRLQLIPRQDPVQVDQDLSLRFGPQQVDLLARFDISTAKSELSLLEWQLVGPQPVLASVRGPGLRRWTQKGNRLLVWLERVATTRLEVQGWMDLQKEPKKSPSLILPQIRLVSEGKQKTLIRFGAQPGLLLTPQQLTGLRPLTEGSAAPLEAVYQASEPYGGLIQVEQGGVRGTARLATLVEVVDRNLMFQTVVTCRIPQGELRSLVVTLPPAWAEATVTIEADRIVQRRERKRPTGSRTWSLDLQPGVTREYTLTLSGSLTQVGETVTPTVPVVQLENLDITERWIVVAGAELQAVVGGGVEASPELPADLPPGFRGSERLRRAGGTVWRVTQPPGDLRLVTNAPMRELGQPCPILLVERLIRSTGRGRWMHEAKFWIRCDEQPEFLMQFPAAVKVMDVTLAGVEIDPVQPTSDRLWVPLPGQSGVLLVRVRWEHAPDAENLFNPLLGTLRFEGAKVLGPTLWAFQVPQGWETGPACELKSGPGPRAVAHLTQASGAIAVAAQLGEIARELGAPTGLELATQQRFYLHLRKAELVLERHPEAQGLRSPEGLLLGEWCQRLAEQNRDQARPGRYNYEEARSEADRQVKAGLVTSGAAASPHPPQMAERLRSMGRSRPAGALDLSLPSGEPLLAVTTEDGEPQIGSLVPVWRSSVQQASTASLVWLGLVGVVAWVSQLEFVVRRLRAFLPEQLLLLGGLGYLLVGWTPVVILLLTLGVIARGLILLRWIAPSVARR